MDLPTWPIQTTEDMLLQPVKAGKSTQPGNVERLTADS